MSKNNIQSDYITVMLSFDGIDFATIEIPRVHYKDILETWEKGEIWQIKRKNGTEFIHMARVVRLKIL